jgi:hypothetical protein
MQLHCTLLVDDTTKRRERMRPEQSEETTILMADWLGPGRVPWLWYSETTYGSSKVITRFEADDANAVSGAETIDLVHFRQSHRSRREFV